MNFSGNPAVFVALVAIEPDGSVQAPFDGDYWRVRR
jgi:hypothetical protein